MDGFLPFLCAVFTTDTLYHPLCNNAICAFASSYSFVVIPGPSHAFCNVILKFFITDSTFRTSVSLFPSCLPFSKPISRIPVFTSMPKQFFAKAAGQISNLALQFRVCGSDTNSQLKNQHISVIFQPYYHASFSANTFRYYFIKKTTSRI